MIAKLEETSLDPINLQGGWPSPFLHPNKLLQDAAEAVLSNENTNVSALMYGPELGSKQLRESLATWLSELYQPASGRIAFDRIAISNGASGYLAQILQKFTDSSYTRRIWMVEPTYFLACPIFHDAGFEGRLRGIPEDTEGIDLEYLEVAMAAVEVGESWRENTGTKTPGGGYHKLYRHVIYAVPTFSNPSAKTMSLARRIGLIKLARKYDALVVTDDVYDVLRWPEDETVDQKSLGRIPPRLVDIDRELDGATEWGNAASNGSFSKIVAPGIRVGWCEAMPAFINAMGTIGSTGSGGCHGHFASTLIEHIISNGSLPTYLEEVLIPTYRKRYYKMINAIKEYLFPLGVQMDMGKAYTGGPDDTSPGVAGGFFLYLHFPDTLPPVSHIAKISKENYALTFAHGAMFAVRGDAGSVERATTSFGEGARLCWAWNNEDILVEGVHRLASVIKDVMTNPPSKLV